ncbi:MAG: D-2-hydroxyacid dehydrogenase [Candidatus Delongbacteria bacterium]|nr:D-2-hydroxyacid dehydrogenase [Candidatus Delongbacteria bacterium]
MKIMVCDKISNEAMQALTEKGFEVDVKTGLTPEQLADVISPYDIVIVRSATKVKKVAIDAGTNLKIIARGGVGLDNIDVEAAKAKGIKVVNTPAASSASVAELALAHLLSIYRFIPQATVTMREGKWEKKSYEGREVSGKTLGIIGIGRIGQELAKRAYALGMKILAFDAMVTQAPLDFITMVDKDRLLKESDVVSLHIPKSKDGVAVIGEREFELMKPNSVLINCARGGVVDEKALLNALNSGKLWGAGIDVFDKEPTDNQALLMHPKVSLTPHIGAATKEAQERIGNELVRVIIEETRS